MAMIAFHTLFDLNFFGIIALPLYSGALGVFAYSIGTAFLVLVGISLHLSRAAAESRLSKGEMRTKFAVRGLETFGLGLIVTAATYVYLSAGYIVFGVLHCIGISILLAYPFLRRPLAAAIVGLCTIVAGIVIAPLTFSFPWLLPLGFSPIGFESVDYFPLLPWLGVVLLGVVIGRILYSRRQRRFAIRDRLASRPARFVAWLGRHSLVIYFLHQLIIVGLISLWQSF